MAEKDAPFEASASAVGYIYQLRKALHSCVLQHGRGIDWCIAIEAGDDIEEILTDGRVLTQLKHRAPGTAMTNLSPDLWKTLRIWAHGVDAHQIDLDETDLLLITTADLPAGAAAYLLQPDSSGLRNETQALKLLSVARQTSSNKENLKAYEAFDALTEVQQCSLFSRIQIIGKAPDIDDVERLLLERCVLAVGHLYAKPFLERLEGWFFHRAIQQLRTDLMDAITGNEFDQKFTELRDQFRPENLPIDEEIAVLRPDTTDHENMLFVRQLELIDIGRTRIGHAVRDYIRAFTQRSRWSDDNLLLPGEISRYERRLTEEWEMLFAEMEEDLGPATTEAEKIVAAKKLYRWATQEARLPIRRDCDESFVSRGSFHILANNLDVGWHIEYTARLIAILEPAEVART